MSTYKADLYRGIITENPTFVFFLGLCPTLALTNNLSNAVGMGVCVVVVLAITNTIISMVRKVIPDDIRIPVFITIIASVVTVVSMLMEAYLPTLFDSLGIYLPLVVVNCIILGRAESFASQNGLMDSFMDGIGSGLGFLLGLSVLGFARELIGTGAVDMLNFRLIDGEFAPSIFVQSSGAFLMFGLIAWITNTIKNNKEKAAKALAKAEKKKKALAAMALKKEREAKEAVAKEDNGDAETKQGNTNSKETKQGDLKDNG